MFVVLFGIVVCTGLTMSMSILGLTQCGRPKCTCFTQRRLVVCTPGLGPPYTHVPTFSRQEVLNMTRINLSGNALTTIGVRDFNEITWPHLEVVDVRLNPHLDCRTLDNIPEGVVVYTDCIEEDYEVDPALVGDGTRQTQQNYDDDDVDNGYQMFETQYDKLQSSESRNSNTGLLDTSSSQVHRNTQFPSNSRGRDESDVRDYSQIVPSNNRMNGFYDNNQHRNLEEFQDTVGDTDETNAEMSEINNGKSSEKNRKPKKVIIEFKGVMKVLIP